MKNLLVLLERRRKLPAAASPPAAAVADSAEGELHVLYADGRVTGYSQEQVLYECAPGQGWQSDVPVMDNFTSGVVGFQSVDDGLCAAWASGLLAVFRPEEAIWEEVGRVDAGISGAAWSPDGEVLAISTKTGALMLLSLLTWDVLAEGSVLAEGEPHRDVETVSICWRGDGKYLATHVPDADSASQGDNCKLTRHNPYGQLRVWEREGLVLHSTCLQSCQGPMSWRPNGSFIAAGQGWRASQGGESTAASPPIVALYERNGLPRTSFPLIYPKTEVGSISWSADSELLLLVLHSAEFTAVQVADGCSVRITDLHAGVIPPPMCHVVMDTSAPVIHASVSGAVDGTQVLAALLSDGSVALLERKSQQEWTELSANPEDVEPHCKPQRVIPPPRLGTDDEEDVGTRARQLAYCDGSLFLAACQSADACIIDAPDTLIAIALGNDKDAMVATTPLTSSIVRLTPFDNGPEPSSHPPRLVVQTENTLFVVSALGKVMSTLKPFPSPCGAMRVGTSPECVIGLTKDRKLLQSTEADISIIASDATSIALFADGTVVYTTLGDLLFVRTNKDSISSGRALEQRARLVCAGVAGGVGVVLQMPRGNLETVYPRPLVLPAVRRLLDSHQFRNALDIARRNRVSLSIIAAHTWPTFLSRASEFVAQVGDASLIGEVLSALRDGEGLDKAGVNAVCEAVRKALVQDANIAEGGRALLRNAWQCVLASYVLRESEMNISPRPSFFPPDTTSSDALAHLIFLAQGVREAKGLEAANGKAGGNVGALPSSRLLFRAALGTYDLHLAAMVAAQAGEDPREFLPELEQLQSLPVALRQAEIDKSLGRWAKALESLSQAGMWERQCAEHFQACLALIRQRQLYQLGLQLFSGGEGGDDGGEKKAAVLELYAEHLERQKEFQEAALAFAAAGQPERALAAYKVGGHWRQALALARMTNRSEPDIVKLAHDLLAQVRVSGRAVEAAQIASQHLGDVKLAADILLEGREWRDAAALAGADTRAPAIEAAETHIAELQEQVEKVSKYLERLQAVRAKRRALALHVREAEEREGGYENGHAVEFDDAASVASTAATNVTGISALSAYNRTASTVSSASGASTAHRAKRAARQQSKKAGRVRAGSPGEELGLIQYIQGLQPHARLKEEVGQLAEVLVMLGEAALARVLRDALARYCEEHAAAQADALSGLPEITAEAAQDTTTEQRDKDAVVWDWAVLRTWQAT
eukprot:jgi/Chlat1/333/Chrsp1S00217